jgi:hypothetical protein
VFRNLRRRRKTALIAVGALVSAGLVSIASPAHAAVACQVTYQKTWDNGSGFGANLTIQNLGDPLTTWTLSYAFPGNQHADQGWSGNWSQTGQNVTVTAMSWNAVQGTGASWGIGFNGSYSGSNVDPTVFAINGTTCTGGATQALVVNPTALSVPEGGMATYSVKLQSAPSGNVTVTSTAGSGDTDLTVSAGGSLTFTPANWNVAQNVTVAAAEDADSVNGSRPITVASSGLTSVNVTATEADNDNAQALVVAPTSVSVPEGNTATFAVRLQSQPSANVTATTTAGSGDADLTVASGGSLTFTPANWSVTQNVTLRAAEDTDTTNGTRAFSVASAGLTSVNVTATEADNDSPQSLVVTPTSLSVAEGGTNTFTVRLQSQPSASVSVSVSAGGGDTDLIVQSGASLTFTSANWNVAQAVTLAAAEDADNTNGSRTFAVASTGLTTVNVTATETDNDPAQALLVTPTAVNVPEGSTAVYAVRLAAQPPGNVTVTSTAGTGDADLTVQSGGSLTFTVSNWNMNQNVTLAAAQDADQTNGARTITVASTGLTSVAVTATEVDDDATQNAYLTEFTTQYNKLKNPANGYFSPEGIPYHAAETLIVEAPDHGHETTSEAFSFWIWLEAQYGRVTGNWTPFNNAWSVMEQYIIPTPAGQPGGSASYNPSDPADYAPEMPQPSGYPVSLNTGVVAGQDPLAGELQSTYGNRNVYGMHWLLDVDNVYGYASGRTSAECGQAVGQRPTYINTYQRGPQESVWETVAHPSCDTGRFANYPSLFIAGSGTNQWRYTDAPDADARAVQAAYWALQWATAQGNQSQISGTIGKAAKMGDFLRYSFYDKYFKNPGCTSTSCTPGSGKSSSSYMLTWYYAWGGDIGGAWAWRIGSSSWHQGYQNPLAAWALSPAGPSALRPLSSTAGSDWATSLQRQLDSYLWLQSSEGAISGGATNSWNGNYSAPPAGTPTFYGWAYDFQPVFHDPPSNQWFGFQVWSLERVAEYYYTTGDAKAKSILDKWVPWAIGQTTLGTGSSFSFPSDMTWSGAPAASISGGTTPGANPNLHVTVVNTSNDVGVGAAYARTLTWYAARAGATTLGTQAKATAKGLLDRMILLKTNDSTGKGIVVSETRNDYNRFDDVWNSTSQTGLYIPPGFSGTMPSGAPINSSSTFMSIRPFYAADPAWGPVQSYMNGTGPAPSFQYHRFWAQSDIAMAFADYGSLFPAG